jgi:hypothetical protein
MGDEQGRNPGANFRERRDLSVYKGVAGCNGWFRFDANLFPFQIEASGGLAPA